MRRPARLRRWTWARRATAAAFLALLALGRFEWFPWFKGATTATTLFGAVPLVDPLAALEVSLASMSLHATLLLGAAIPLAAAVLLGPVFCGWICPLGLVLDLNQELRRRLPRRLRRRLGRGGSLPRWTRHLALGLALGFSLAAGIPAFQLLSPINLLAWSVIFGLASALWVIALIAAAEWFAPHAWCRSLCPLGALYAGLGRFALLRVRVRSEHVARRRCRLCTLGCPMGIRVMEEHVVACRSALDHPDCTRCGDCIDACPEGVLRLGFASPRESAEGAAAAGRHRSTAETGPEALAADLPNSRGCHPSIPSAG